MADRSAGPSRPVDQDSAASGNFIINKLKKKKKKPKKRKTRRESFVNDDPHDPHQDHPVPIRPSLQGTSSNPNPDPRDSFYRLGRADNSSESLRSDALLDHRDSGPLQVRRQSIHSSLYGNNSQSRLGFPFGRLARNGSSSRLQRGGTAAPDLSFDDDNANDNTPLLPGSNYGDGRGRHGYTSTVGAITSRFASALRRSSRGSSTESPRRSRIFDVGKSGATVDEYDVNNPPSMPGSPIIDAARDYADTVFVEQRQGDAIIDVDGTLALDRDVETPGGGMKRRMTLPAEEDVCFPQDILSEIAEEDLARHETGEQPIRRHRRSRKRWPDIEVLEAWRREEKEERYFDDTKARRVQEPLLVEGRLRPKKVQWQWEAEYAPFRFTYFNEQFESTIHSHTISDLLQPGQSFDDLFNPQPVALSDSSSDEDEQPMQSTLQSNFPVDNERTHSINSATQSTLQKSDLLRSFTNKTLLNSSSSGPSGRATPIPGQSPSPPDKYEKPVRFGPKPVFWLDVLQPTEDEMKVIAKAFGLHPLTAEDITQQDPREKVELFKNYYFIVYRSFEQDSNREDYLEPLNMYVAVFRDCILSFHFSPCPHPANVRRRCRQLSDYIICTPDWISYGLIDDITDAYGPLIQSIEEEVDDIDERILNMYSDIDEIPKQKKEEAKQSSDILREVGECRKKVMGLYRLLGAKADVIKGFAKRCNEQWEVAPRSDIGMYLGDIQDHIVTMTGNLSHYENLLSRAHTNYLTQINLRMNERAEKTNDVLGKLTVLGTIVLPMNIVTGLWGMNVRVPGEDGEKGDLGWFLGITSSIVGVGLLFFFIAKLVWRVV